MPEDILRKLTSKDLWRLEVFNLTLGIYVLYSSGNNPQFLKDLARNEGLTRWRVWNFSYRKEHSRLLKSKPRISNDRTLAGAFHTKAKSRILNFGEI